MDGVMRHRGGIERQRFLKGELVPKYAQVESDCFRRYCQPRLLKLAAHGDYLSAENRAQFR